MKSQVKRVVLDQSYERPTGPDNLLINCAGLRPGKKILFVNEIGKSSVEKSAVDRLERRAKELGGVVRSIWEPKVRGPEEIRPELLDAIAQAEITVFNHTVGAILRFSHLPGTGVCVDNFAAHNALLDSDWARVPYELWEQLSGLIAARLWASKRWCIKCPNGTDLSGTVSTGANQTSSEHQDFTVLNFPIGTHAPLPITDASGKIALRWFPNSKIHDFGPALSLNEAILARVESGRIVGFEGSVSEVSRAKKYLQDVGASTGKDPLILNSWHAGVNPQAFTPWKQDSDYGIWLSLTHNNPRTLHFHAVGTEMPGELSLPIIDHTVEFDGVVIWERGKFKMLDQPEFQNVAAQWDNPQLAFALRPDIGI